MTGATISPEPAGHTGCSDAMTRSLRWVSVVVICGTAALAVGFYRHRGGAGYPLDDTWIHLAFARNLAEGAGFGVNPGEPTPGATSPLWVILLSVGFMFGAGAEHWPWILDGGFVAACGLLGAWLCRKLQADSADPQRAVVESCICGLAIVTCFPLVWSAAGAMEVPLFSALLLATLAMFIRSRRRRWPHAVGWGVCAGLAANARPEGLLFIGIVAVMELATAPSQRLRRAGVGLATGLLLTVPYGLFCLSTSGRWFPNTYYAKTTSTALAFPDLDYLRNLAGLAWQIGPEVVLVLVPAIIALFTGWRRDRLRSAPGIGLIYVLALPIAYASMDRSLLFAGLAGNFGRYLFPLFPLVIVIGCAGLFRLAALRGGRTLPGMAIILGIVFAGSCVWRTVSRADLYAQSVRDINRIQVRMAEALRERLAPGTLVAANDVGALAYLTDLRVFDLVGLVSTDVLEVRRPAGMESPPPEELALLRYLAKRRPAVLVIFPHWYPGIVLTLEPGLHVLVDLEVPDNITSGGSRLVAFQVDWHRILEGVDSTRDP